MLAIDLEQAKHICSCEGLLAVPDRNLWLRVAGIPNSQQYNWWPRTKAVCCLTEGKWDALDVLSACADVKGILPASIWKPKHFREWEGLDEDTIARVCAIKGIAPYYRKPARPTRFRSWPLFNLLSGRPIGSRRGSTYIVANALVLVGLASFDRRWTGIWDGRTSFVKWLPPAMRQPELLLSAEDEEALARFV